MFHAYPSALPESDLRRIDALATRLIEGLGLTHGMFNIEMRIDPTSGAIGVIEINPRAAGRFHRLYAQIDFHPRGHEMPADRKSVV